MARLVSALPAVRPTTYYTTRNLAFVWTKTDDVWKVMFFFYGLPREDQLVLRK